MKGNTTVLIIGIILVSGLVYLGSSVFYWAYTEPINYPQCNPEPYYEVGEMDCETMKFCLDEHHIVMTDRYDLITERYMERCLE